MVKVNFHLTQKQYDWLKRKSETSGLSIAELIRRALDESRAKEKRGERETEQV